MMRWLTLGLVMGCGSAERSDAGDVFDRIRQVTLSSTPGVFEATCGGSQVSYWRVDFTTHELDFEDCRPPLARGQFELDEPRLERLRTSLRAIKVPDPAVCVTDGPTVSLVIDSSDQMLRFKDVPRVGPGPCPSEPGVSLTQDVHRIRSLLRELASGQ